MSTPPPNPAGAPVPTPVAPAGSTPPPRAKAGKTPFCPPDLAEPWYAGVWNPALGDWSIEPQWFDTWQQAYDCARDLAHFPLWLAEIDA